MKLIRTQWAGLLALFVVLTGAGAYAAFDPIGSDGDIDACFAKKSGDLDVRKGAKCGKGEKSVTWSQAGPPGPEGAQGPQGLTGEPGQAGPAGRSALEPLRSGETTRGVVGGQEEAAAPDTEYFSLATLPVPAGEPLTDSAVIVDGPYENSTTCTGSFANPTAPAGRVCIYEAHPGVGINTIEEEGTAAAFLQAATPYGFAARWYADAAGDARFAATWAYTAP